MELLWWSEPFFFLRPFFFLVTWQQKRNPVPTHLKDFCEKQYAKGTRFFQGFF